MNTAAGSYSRRVAPLTERVRMVRIVRRGVRRASRRGCFGPLFAPDRAGRVREMTLGGILGGGGFNAGSGADRGGAASRARKSGAGTSR